MFTFQIFEKLMRQFYWFSNNDLPIIILSQLPTKKLHSLKYVSKDWLILISDRTFVASQLQKTEPVSGFFFQEVFQWTDEEGVESISYIPADVEKVTVWRTVLEFLPENVVILSLNNGLMCCRSCFPNPDTKIYICNPLNKQWTSLRWPDSNNNVSQQSSIALSFDPFQNTIDKSTSFKLVAVSSIKQDETEEEEEEEIEEIEDEYCFSFDIYSSETGSWRRLDEVCLSNHNFNKNKNVMVDGICYWLTDGYTVLSFDPQNEISWLVVPPLLPTEFSSVPEMCIGESGGKLQYVITCEDGLQLWVLEDRFGSAWELRHFVELGNLERENPSVLYRLSEKMAPRLSRDTPAWIEPLSLKDGRMLVRVSVNLYLYEFESGKMKKLCHMSTLGPKSMFSPIVVPYAMSLVPIG